jgi:Tfp pilus assembly protein PilN
MVEHPQSLLEEELRKPEEVEIGWPWRLLVFSFFIFIVVLITFLGIKFGYQPYLDNKIKTLDSEIDKLSQSVSQSQIDDFIAFYSQLSNLKVLLNNHVFGSNVLKFLEDNSLKSVVYISADVDARLKGIKLSGVVPSYEALAQQIEVFRQSPLVKEVSFKKAQQNEQKEIGFDLEISLADNFFKEASALPSSSNISVPAIPEISPSVISTSTNKSTSTHQ